MLKSNLRRSKKAYFIAGAGAGKTLVACALRHAFVKVRAIIIWKRKVATVKCLNDILSLGNASSWHMKANQSNK